MAEPTTLWCQCMMCFATVRAPAALAGRDGRCPHCKAPVPVPDVFAIGTRRPGATPGVPLPALPNWGRDVFARATTPDYVKRETGSEEFLVAAACVGWSRARVRLTFDTHEARTDALRDWAAARERGPADPPVALVFRAAPDVGTASSHRRLDGLVAAAEDPVWTLLLPPLDWGCRCSVRIADASELAERGLVRGKAVRRTLPDGVTSDDLETALVDAVRFYVQPPPWDVERDAGAVERCSAT